MTNKYVAVIENDYDDGLYGTTITEYMPFRSKYTKDEIDQDYFHNTGGSSFKPFYILDTGIFINENNRLREVFTIQEWFTNYATGIPDKTTERNNVDNV